MNQLIHFILVIMKATKQLIKYKQLILQKNIAKIHNSPKFKNNMKIKTNEMENTNINKTFYSQKINMKIKNKT